MMLQLRESFFICHSIDIKTFCRLIDKKNLSLYCNYLSSYLFCKVQFLKFESSNLRKLHLLCFYILIEIAVQWRYVCFQLKTSKPSNDCEPIFLWQLCVKFYLNVFARNAKAFQFSVFFFFFFFCQLCPGLQNCKLVFLILNISHYGKSNR